MDCASIEIPSELSSSQVVEQAAGIIGVAACRARDKQVLYDDLGALLSIIQDFRHDLRTVHKVK